MNILYVDPVVGTQNGIKYPYYNGMFQALSIEDDVTIALCQQIPSDLDLLLENANFDADFVIFGLGWFGHYRYFEKIKNNKKIPTAVFLFKPQNDWEAKLNFCKINDVDLILTPVPLISEIEEETGITTKRMEYGCFTNIFRNVRQEKQHDLGFSGAMHASNLYPKGNFENNDIRSKIYNRVKDTDLKLFWKGNDSFDVSRIHNYQEYAAAIGQCKIWLATLASHGDVTPRYYEVLASNTLLFCEEPSEIYFDLLQDGINCVFFKSDLSDFEEKLYYYLKNDDERNKIIDNANKSSIKKIDWRTKSSNLLKILKLSIDSEGKDE